MEIHAINLLTPMSVQVSDGDSEKRSVLVFYDNDTGRVIFHDKADEVHADQIVAAVVEYCASPVEEADFRIPAQIIENISHARQGDSSFFGLTQDLKSWSNENKKEVGKDGRA